MALGARADPLAQEWLQAVCDRKQSVLAALAAEDQQFPALEVHALDPKGACLGAAQPREQHDGEETAIARAPRSGEQALGLIWCQVNGKLAAGHGGDLQQE